MVETLMQNGRLQQVHPVALVVAATGGIGLATLRLLLQQPQWQTIYASSRSHSEALQLLASDHPQLRILQMDIAEESSIDAAMAVIRNEQTALGLLCNTAGLLHDNNSGLNPEKRLKDLSAENLKQIFAVNAFGAGLLMRAAEPLLRRQPAIVANISAKVGSIEDNHLGGWYSYRAAKAAQNMLTKTASIELGRRNKKLTAIAFHPGTTDTELSAPFQQNVSAEKLFSSERCAQQFLQVLDKLTPSDNGCFKSWDNSNLPW